MSETLHEVATKMKHRRKWIAPTVRNLDTGETFSVKEMDHKIPKGVDPSIFSDQTRIDVGEVICRPFVPLIPKWVTPNAITYTNHAVNWILLLSMVALDHISEMRPRVYIIITGAVLNFICMMLDCLDGMHARNTKQTSKLGEVLDHYFDAVHTPFVTGAVMLALRLPKWAIATIMVGNVAVYNSQLIVYHYQRIFVPTAGVEGQIGTSIFFLFGE